MRRVTRPLSAVAATAALSLLLGGCGGSKPSEPKQADKVQQGAAQNGTGQGASVDLSKAPPPWQPPLQDSTTYIEAAGLPVYAQEKVKVHYHAHLDIWANGSAVPVAPYIGFVVKDNKATGISPLHTHDDSGVVHIESADNSAYTLGQLFTEWGVSLSETCIGGLCKDATHDLRFYVNGVAYAGDPDKIVFKSHMEIAIQYGKPSELPKPPAGYNFPAGE